MCGTCPSPRASAASPSACIAQRGQSYSTFLIIVLLFCSILPPQFPMQPPDIRLMVQATHVWVDPQLRILGHPQLRQWSPSANLGTIVRDIVTEFKARPPQPKQLSPAVGVPNNNHSPASSGLPSHVNNQIHSGSAAAQQAAAHAAQAAAMHQAAHAHERKDQHQPPPPSSSPPSQQHQHGDNGNNLKQVQHAAVPPVPHEFPILDTFSTYQLEEILENSDKYQEVLEQISVVKSQTALRDQLYDGIEDIAKSNLGKQEQVLEETSKVKELRDELEVNTQKLNELLARQRAVMGKFSAANLLKLLSEAADQADNKCRDLREQYDDEELDHAAYCKQYIKQRTKYHLYAAKKERLQEEYGLH
eukprot:TRINITY_DN8598_c0_g1_i1.p1 TRINITY_DN8598_c0_g1~~TRINITY_DN8598_c0_g1_i1.p1  ORF type:complete len:361 (+),score=167.29 TRINITY_DN8598_c0_g1_i1:163-1245(+)